MPFEDSFTMFRRKKEAERAAQLAAKAAAAAGAEQHEEGRPKGFRRGRYAKPKGPVDRVVPKGMRAFRRQKGEPVPGVAAKPRGFTRDRAEATPVDPSVLRTPEGFDRGREVFVPGKPPDAVPPPDRFEATRIPSKPLAPGEILRPKGFRRY